MRLYESHRRWCRVIDAYIDGELAPTRMAAVEAHLDDCWDCTGYADTVRLMKQSLQRLAGRGPTSLMAARLRRWAGGLG